MTSAFSDSLKNIMMRKNTSGGELARRTGITRRQVARYLNGSSEPTVTRLIAIAKALDVSLDELAGYRGGRL